MVLASFEEQIYGVFFTFLAYHRQLRPPESGCIVSTKSPSVARAHCKTYTQTTRESKQWSDSEREKERKGEREKERGCARESLGCTKKKPRKGGERETEIGKDREGV